MVASGGILLFREYLSQQRMKSKVGLCVYTTVDKVIFFVYNDSNIAIRMD